MQKIKGVQTTKASGTFIWVTIPIEEYYFLMFKEMLKTLSETRIPRCFGMPATGKKNSFQNLCYQLQNKK